MKAVSLLMTLKFFFIFIKMWTNAKANHVSTMQLVMMMSTDSAANVHLDGVEHFVILVNAKKDIAYQALALIFGFR